MSFQKLTIIDRALSEYRRNPGNTIPDNFKKELRSSNYLKEDVQFLLDHVKPKENPSGNPSSALGTAFNAPFNSSANKTASMTAWNPSHARGWQQELEAIVARMK